MTDDEAEKIFVVKEIIAKFARDFSLDPTVFDIKHAEILLRMKLPDTILRTHAPDFLKIALPIFLDKTRIEKCKTLIEMGDNKESVSDESYLAEVNSCFQHIKGVEKLMNLGDSSRPNIMFTFDAIVLKWEGDTYMEEYGSMWRFNHYCIRKAFPENKIAAALITFLTN